MILCFNSLYECVWAHTHTQWEVERELIAISFHSLFYSSALILSYSCFRYFVIFFLLSRFNSFLFCFFFLLFIIIIVIIITLFGRFHTLIMFIKLHSLCLVLHTDALYWYMAQVCVHSASEWENKRARATVLINWRALPHTKYVLVRE